VRDLASVGGLAMDWLGNMHELRCYVYLYLMFLRLGYMNMCPNGKCSLCIQIFRLSLGSYGKYAQFSIAHRGPTVSIVLCLFCQTIHTRIKLQYCQLSVLSALDNCFLWRQGCSCRLLLYNLIMAKLFGRNM
jgi:hypothetical protein